MPRETDFSVDSRKLIRAGEKAKIMIVCTPNNPTGNATPVDEVAELLEEIEGVLFLDNAYVEFSRYDYLPLLKKYENLILGRTFSKIHSLAGLRIGYAFVPGWFVPWYSGPAHRLRLIRYQLRPLLPHFPRRTMHNVILPR